MNALVNITENETCNLQNITEDNIILLKDKIEESIVNDRQILAIVTNSFSECRYKMHIENCELDEDYLYLTDDNFEIHITPKNVKELKYENECFTIAFGENEVVLIF